MATKNQFRHTRRGRDSEDCERDGMPLDSARAAFEWLVTGPHPVCLDGRLFPGLPARRVPLNEVRDRLLRRRCPQGVRDAVWAHLVLRSRTEGATWTVGCVGVALPALTRIAAMLSARFAGEVTDIHAAVLAGFLAELARVDLTKPRIMLRLRWAAYRAGHTVVREALDAPVPSGYAFRSSPARADKSSAQVTGVIGRLRWDVGRPAVFRRGGGRHHDRSWCCAWPTSPRPISLPCYACCR
ncbi:hypothetical protein [Saccharopolyspora phatthalungensis]|uniref:Uncharacterized protein n=1 Tax=Saccharopolyspora phatthalungensis TaxID=664693 RepID=A0A840Q8N2_9PSEU|nr:hypothetical protein [Saccharopolyspora phatthalungensis]MBB5156806.1 hypothetical protein [Saccharopolyspora phatthalungensis]